MNRIVVIAENQEAVNFDSTLTILKVIKVVKDLLKKQAEDSTVLLRTLLNMARTRPCLGSKLGSGGMVIVNFHAKRVLWRRKRGSDLHVHTFKSLS